MDTQPGRTQSRLPEYDWLEAARQRYERNRKAAEEHSAEFYGDNPPTTVRDIDWPDPPCPVCDLALEHDGGWWCDVCCVYWSDNGTSPRRDLELVADRALDQSPGPTTDDVAAGPVTGTGEHAQLVDRILWNVDGGEVDEIVLHGVTVHVEQMTKRCWWIGVYKGNDPESPYWMGNFTCDSRGRMTFTEQDNGGVEWDREAAHSRGPNHQAAPQ